MVFFRDIVVSKTLLVVEQIFAIVAGAFAFLFEQTSRVLRRKVLPPEYPRLIIYGQILAIFYALAALIPDSWPLFAPFPIPGVSSACIALVSAVMTIRHQMSKREKVVWLTITTMCFWVEVRSLYVAADQDRSSRERQIKQLDDLHMQAQASLAQNQDQFNASMLRFDDVSQKTSDAADRATEGVNILTGGDSYVYVYPDINDATDPARGYGFKAHNEGEYALTGIQVKITKVLFDSPPGPALITMGKTMNLGPATTITIGTLFGNTGETIPNFRLQIEMDLDGKAQYHVWISAQNRPVVEDLFFRRSKDRKLVDYKFSVFEILRKKERPTDKQVHEGWLQYLKSEGWKPPKFIR